MCVVYLEPFFLHVYLVSILVDIDRTPLPVFFSFFALHFFPRFSSPFSPCSPFPFFILSFRLAVSVCFLYGLIRFSFRSPAFLGGGFCYTVTSSQCHTPPALLASLKYASPCVLSSFLRSWCWFIWLYFRFRFGHRCFILSVSCGYYCMLSPLFRFQLRLVWHMICILIRTHAESHLHIFGLSYTIYFSYCVILFAFHLFSSWVNLPLQTYWSLSCNLWLHRSDELMW